MRPLSRNGVLVLIGLTLVLHTAEEYVTFPRFLSAGRFPPWLHPRLIPGAEGLHVALVMATVLPLVVIAWAMLRPHKGLLIAALLLSCVLLVNAGWHILAAFVRGGYAPGIITAVLINLPFGMYVLQRALKEQWVGTRTAWLLLGVAFLLHFVALGSLLAG